MSRQSKAELARAVADEFRINQNQSDMFDEHAARLLGINLTDLRCLDIVSRQGRVTAGELATEADLSTGAVTAVIDRLERAGYVRRERDARDRRRVHVESTDPGETDVAAIWGPLVEDWGAQLESCTQAELEFLLRFMRAGNEIARDHLERIRERAAAEDSR